MNGHARQNVGPGHLVPAAQTKKDRCPYGCGSKAWSTTEDEQMKKQIPLCEGVHLAWAMVGVRFERPTAMVVRQATSPQSSSVRTVLGRKKWQKKVGSSHRA